MPGAMRRIVPGAVAWLAAAGFAPAQDGSQSGAPTFEPPPMFVDHGDTYTRDLTFDIRDLVREDETVGGAAQDLASGMREMAAGSGGDIAMRETEDSIVLSVASDVLFDFDSAALTAPARETLTRIAGLLAASEGQTVEVVGHTDAIGPEEYNQTLSEERAASVVAFLTGNGVPEDRLAATGRGETEPVAPNTIDGADDPEGRARNRRVEFVLPK